jgi:hypothetical protein
MLLIGSRAAKFHFRNFRRPHDWDFIGTTQEVEDFLSQFQHERLSSHANKIRAKIFLKEGPRLFEFELTEMVPSSLSLLEEDNETEYFDPLLNVSYNVASPETLFLLKKSHICFNIHWRKSIIDYQFLYSRVDQSKLDEKWNKILLIRLNEIKKRISYKEMDFDLDNEAFFQKSEKFVKRCMPHDDIHKATCFFDEPLFNLVKDDLTKAAMSPDKVNSLSHDLKIKLIQEEAIALSLERSIIPALKKKEPFNATQAYQEMVAKMVYNYLPMWLRFFAADNFREISRLNVDYVSKFLSNIGPEYEYLQRSEQCEDGVENDAIQL